MAKILVIADDFTGAAEIAGIAQRFGLATEPARSPGARGDADAIVLDSDSRSLAPAEAAAVVRQFLVRIDPSRFDLIYKKIDSVLRGNVMSELEAAIDSLGKTRAILLPQNPSHGRTVEDGTYRIRGVPISATAFARDPEHPRRSSDVLELLGSPQRTILVYRDQARELLESGVILAGASTEHHVRQWAASVDRATLAAGGADFFTAHLEKLGLRESRTSIESLDPGRALFVCGSVSAYAQELCGHARRLGIPICAMPEEIFRKPAPPQSALDEWAAQTAAAIDASGAAMMAITHPLDRSPGAAQRLGELLGDVVSRILGGIPVNKLFLEGGSTASAICRKMTWDEFTVEGELAPGIVALIAGGRQRLFVKPGSYAWPDVVWNSFAAK